jgi:hypothetical protein
LSTLEVADLDLGVLSTFEGVMAGINTPAPDLVADFSTSDADTLADPPAASDSEDSPSEEVDHDLVASFNTPVHENASLIQSAVVGGATPSLTSKEIIVKHDGKM